MKIIKSFLICVALLGIVSIATAQDVIPQKKVEQIKLIVTGVVTDINESPMEGIIVRELGTNNSVLTNKRGIYSIQVSPNAVIEFVSIDVEPKSIEIIPNEVRSYEAGNISIMNISFDERDDYKDIENYIGSGGSTSMKNYWIGAKVGYNFIGETDDNFFVGSASIALNMFEGSNDKHSFAVIGNLGNFKFDKDTDSSEDVQKIAQSINGLSVGLGYTRQFILGKSNDSIYFRPFVRTGVRMTTFDEIGENMESVNLAQSATNAGLELEIGRFKKGGAISISTGLTMYLFDENVYNKIFEEKKSSLFTLDTTIILPISKDLGFFINGTFTKRASAAYILGIIFRS